MQFQNDLCTEKDEHTAMASLLAWLYMSTLSHAKDTQ